MTRSAFQRTLPRLILGFLWLGVFGLQGAQGQAPVHEMRIGLQTKQPAVRLLAGVPVRVETAHQDPLTLPAEQPLIFQARKGGGVALTDAAGAELLTASDPVRVIPVPPSADAPPLPAPLVCLLGPTRHYDGKADRPYRGSMELLPRADGLTVVNVVNVEEYLLGVVSSEMGVSYPLEALKAQAVAARTYALKNQGRMSTQGYDLDDTAACQVYGGYFSEDPRTSHAVEETAGQVLTYDGQLIDAVYSSTCGGYTESAEEAWGRAVPYLVGVSDFQGEVDPAIAPQPRDEAGWAAYCMTARGLNCLQPKYARPEAFRWVKLITRKELEAGLPADCRVGTVRSITVLHRGASGRITALQLDGSEHSVTLQSELTIRKAFGKLRSSAFTVEIYRDDNDIPVVFAFWGAGWGHGLGMCQVGAVGLAELGKTYDAILTHYYHGVRVEQR